MRFSFNLTGATAFLMHADIVENADILEEWRKDPLNKNFSKKGDDRSPPWTWQMYLYSDGTHISLPGDNLMTCLRVAATKINMVRQESFKKTSQSGLLITHEHCAFSVAGKKIPIDAIEKMRGLPFVDQASAAKSLGFSLFVKRARIAKSKNVRVRARFDDWEVQGTIEIIDPAITPSVLAQMFDIAGSNVGLGDWRPSAPESPGPFGKFTAKISQAK